MVRTVDGEYLSNTYCIPKTVSTGKDVAHGSVKDWIRQHTRTLHRADAPWVSLSRFSSLQVDMKTSLGFCFLSPPASEQDVAASMGVTLGGA